MQMEMRDVGQPITGYYPVPLRHGMTVGEVARYINAEYDVGADLHVVPAAGWEGNEWFDETGLPWVDPSPNIRSLTAALNYAGLVLFEATNLSVGRGTDAPFSYVGAPWLDAAAVLEAARAEPPPGRDAGHHQLRPAGGGLRPLPRRAGARRSASPSTTATPTAPSGPRWCCSREIRKLHPRALPDHQRGLHADAGLALGARGLRARREPDVIWQRWAESWRRGRGGNGTGSTNEMLNVEC